MKHVSLDYMWDLAERRAEDAQAFLAMRHMMDCSECRLQYELIKEQVESVGLFSSDVGQWADPDPMTSNIVWQKIETGLDDRAMQKPVVANRPKAWRWLSWLAPSIAFAATAIFGVQSIYNAGPQPSMSEKTETAVSANVLNSIIESEETVVSDEWIVSLTQIDEPITPVEVQVAAKTVVEPIKRTIKAVARHREPQPPPVVEAILEPAPQPVMPDPETLYREGRYLEAKEVALMKLSQCQQPQCSRLRFVMALSLRALGRYDDAQLAFGMVHEHSGDRTLSGKALYERAVILADYQHATDAASELFLHYLRDYPQGIFGQEARFRLCEIGLTNERYKACNDYLESFPDGYRASTIRWSLANRYVKDRDGCKEAIGYLDRIESDHLVKNQSERLDYLRIRCHNELGQDQKAAVAARHYLRTYPNGKWLGLARDIVEALE